MQQMSIISKETVIAQFLRYLVVGGIAFAVDFGVLVLLTETLSVWYFTSAAIAFCSGLATNYLLSITWVFSTRSLTNQGAEFAIFSIIGIVGLSWNQLLMYLGTDVVRFDYRISKLFTVAIILVWNFGMRKILLFSRPRQ